MNEVAPKVIAGCIIRDERGRYLMVQERQEKVYGMWNIPAGWSDEGETPAATAVRETKEEVGLDVVLAEGPVFQFENSEKGRRYFAFPAQITDGKLKIQESELLDAQWLSFSDILSLQQVGKIREQWIMDALTEAENANSRH